MLSFVPAMAFLPNWPAVSNGRLPRPDIGLWTKLLKNIEHRQAKITKKRFKGLDQPPHYSSPTVQYTRRARLHLSAHPTGEYWHPQWTN